MECKVHWVHATGMSFVAETGTGHLPTWPSPADDSPQPTL